VLVGGILPGAFNQQEKQVLSRRRAKWEASLEPNIYFISLHHLSKLFLLFRFSMHRVLSVATWIDCPSYHNFEFNDVDHLRNELLRVKLTLKVCSGRSCWPALLDYKTPKWLKSINLAPARNSRGQLQKLLAKVNRDEPIL
jgi:hypothetical protein